MSIIYKGEVIKKDETFLKKSILQDSSFLLLSGSLEVIKWKRFRNLETSDYFYMSDTYFDAVVFKPKIDVYFLGFGLFKHYEGATYTLTFKYSIEQEQSEEFNVEVTKEMYSENGIYFFDFQELGMPPVKVSAEANLHVCVKSRCSTNNRFNYGY